MLVKAKDIKVGDLLALGVDHWACVTKVSTYIPGGDNGGDYDKWCMENDAFMVRLCLDDDNNPQINLDCISLENVKR